MVAEIVACALAGGLAGLLVLAAFDPHSQATDMDTTAILGGAAVAIGINRFLRS